MSLRYQGTLKHTFLVKMTILCRAHHSTQILQSCNGKFNLIEPYTTLTNKHIFKLWERTSWLIFLYFMSKTQLSFWIHFVSAMFVFPSIYVLILVFNDYFVDDKSINCQFAWLFKKNNTSTKENHHLFGKTIKKTTHR